MESNTFVDLYYFLQQYANDNIFSWIEIPWKGKDKQESLLRLFAGLRLFENLNDYDVCKGNFNLNTINKQTNYKDVFYDINNKPINLKDKGDSSDLTCVSKNNDKHLLLTTSKNLNKTNINKLDIEKILMNFKQYNGYTMSLCICIRDTTEFRKMVNGIEITNKELKAYVEKEDTIIIDWNDLNQAYNQFKLIFNNKNIDDIFNSNKSILCLKLHQQMGVLKTLRMKDVEKKNKILWGHIQRSGKSYIICGCIIQDSIYKDTCNYLVITTAPNETIEQQIKVFDCFQLQEFNIITLSGNNKKNNLTKKNIIICSKQYLQTKIDKQENEKTKIIKWLKDIKFDMRFLDESHNGGTTELTQKTLECYGNNVFTIHITATYTKPINDYNIPKENWILWDLDDIKLCKNINNKENHNRLIEKHGNDIENLIQKYSLDNIVSEYSKYPDLWLLTDEINTENVSEILNETRNNNYGWSPEACFLLKQGINNDNEKVIKEEFQNENETLKLWYRIFGKKGKFDIPDKDYPDNKVFIKRIEKICKNPDIDSRFIGESEFSDEPMIIMAFLPQNNINEISSANIKLLEKHNTLPNYVIIAINSKTTNDPKQTIEDARIHARNSNKKGVLVLSGRQCSLGVSIENCDIVLLLNNSMSFDMIYQMMFRCMTEGKNKKCGFVVDLNIHRVIESSIINYASLIKPDEHPREATKYILQERLINLNGDHWMPTFGNDVTKLTALCKNVYKLYSSNTENALNHFLNRLRFKKILLTKDEQKVFNAMFNSNKPSKEQKELIEKMMEDDEEKIKKGIEKTKVEIDDMSSETNNVEKEENKTNYMDILKHIIPLICLLTIHDKETSFIEMFELIENDKYIYNILIDQTKSWWGNDIDSKIIKKFINIYIKHMKDDKETNQIIRTVKELFSKNVKNNKKLSKLIDKYILPQELEKKSNAEVSTHYQLRREMLDNIPVNLWESIHKVFEPCAGKGGFLIDIIDRFMDGLKDIIPDEDERYKTIVQKCLYFSDINSTNIFICKLLIDPYNEYELNYNEGNTLELNIKDTWGIDGFDAVIGNPPYNENPDDTNDPHMAPVYQKWIYALTKLSRQLMFITPSKWFTAQDKPLTELRCYMKNCNIKFIKHFAQDNIFSNVKIKGGVSYYIIDKHYDGTTLFNNEEIDMNKYDIILEPMYYQIVDHLNDNNHFRNSLRDIYCSQGTFINSKTEKELNDNKHNALVCYVSKAKGFKKYISTDKVTKHYDYWKVITPAAAYKGKSGFSNIFIGTNSEIHSRSYISFKLDTKEEAENLCSYLNCKLPHVLLSARKITHNLCNDTLFQWIPSVPLNTAWNNKKIYEYFQFDDTLISIIESIQIDGSFK